MMRIFGKKKATETACTCGGKCGSPAAESFETPTTSQGDEATVKILGSGCKKCNDLEANTREALKNLAMDEKIEHITDFAEIAAYGVMSTPALVVNNKVLVFGKVAKVEEIMLLLKKEQD